MGKQRAKGQHYIPCAAYLNRFAFMSGKRLFLYVYPVDKSGGIKFVQGKRIQPAKLCKETYMYESPKLPVNAIEDCLADVEIAYNQILQAKILTKQPLTAEDKEIVSLFVSSLEARVPTMRNILQRFVGDLESKVQSMEEQFDNGRESDTHQEIKKAVHTVFSQSITVALGLNRWQFSNFLFLHNESFRELHYGGFFISSDCPVTLYDFALMNNRMWGFIPGSRTIEVVVPLTSHLMLFINNQGIEGHREIEPNFIYEANNRILGSALSRGYIISPHIIDEKIADRFIRRHRQSFILKYKEGPLDSDGPSVEGPPK